MKKYRCVYGELSEKRGGREAFVMLKWEKPVHIDDAADFLALARQHLKEEIQLDQHTFVWTADKAQLGHLIQDPDSLREDIAYGVVFMEDGCACRV